MTAVLDMPTTGREGALATDVAYAERRAHLAEAKEAEAIRRARNAEKDNEAFVKGFAELQTELVTLRLREHDLEVRNALLMKLLARESSGLMRHEIPENADTPRRFFVIRAATPRLNQFVGQPADLVKVTGNRNHGAILTLQFADGSRAEFLPGEVINL